MNVDPPVFWIRRPWNPPLVRKAVGGRAYIVYIAIGTPTGFEVAGRFRRPRDGRGR